MVKKWIHIRVKYFRNHYITLKIKKKNHLIYQRMKDFSLKITIRKKQYIQVRIGKYKFYIVAAISELFYDSLHSRPTRAMPLSYLYNVEAGLSCFVFFLFSRLKSFVMFLLTARSLLKFISIRYYTSSFAVIDIQITRLNIL